ncbi:trehalase family glycosidase, partial [Salmonella enterica subsp. enterica serovar Virginia]|nr:trehalase family glycosidase [Salmonella enterica subsp. enterica serovar Virginia]
VPGKHENNPYSDYISHVFWPSRSLRLYCPTRHTARPSGKYDRSDTPRDESWLEDVETAKHSGRPPNEVYRDLRAGAASGWDYSSR